MIHLPRMAASRLSPDGQCPVRSRAFRRRFTFAVALSNMGGMLDRRALRLTTPSVSARRIFPAYLSGLYRRKQWIETAFFYGGLFLLLPSSPQSSRHFQMPSAFSSARQQPSSQFALDDPDTARQQTVPKAAYARAICSLSGNVRTICDYPREC